MTALFEYARLTKNARIRVGVFAPPHYELPRASVTMLLDSSGTTTEASAIVTQEEAIAFADSMNTLAAFIHSAFGLHDSYAEEFERRMRESQAIGLTDPD